VRRLPLADESVRFVEPAPAHGTLARRRRAVFAALLGAFVAMPFVPIGGHPALLLDVGGRHLFAFGAAFGPEDLGLLVFLATGVAFALVVATALFGRVFCGWACPHTLLVALSRGFERLAAHVTGATGARARDRRRAAPSSTLAHATKIAAAAALALVFLAYFVPPGSLARLVRAPGQEPTLALAAVGIAALLAFVSGSFRERLCLYVCPYGRVQAALVDADSITIGYDAGRGEPRGKAREGGHGDCVDCQKCVAVCPTGIDIRDGVQLDCVGCTACIDACDDVMARLGRAPGLVRYDSARGLAGEPRRVVRPRLWLYAALGVVGALALLLTTTRRRDVDATLLRVPGPPYALTSDGVENALHVHVASRRTEPIDVRIEAGAGAGARCVVPLTRVHLEPLGSVDAPVFVTAPAASPPPEVRVTVQVDASEPRVLTAPFLAPVHAALATRGAR
jgi:cytochrome c oxidase accessory protein FixG